MSLGAWGTMVAANVAVALPDVVSAAMHGIIPSLAFALWHALVHGRRPRPADADRQPRERKRERQDEPERERLPLSAPVPRLPARVEVRRLLKQRGTAVDAKAVRERTGVVHSARTPPPEGGAAAAPPGAAGIGSCYVWFDHALFAEVEAGGDIEPAAGHGADPELDAGLETERGDLEVER